MGTWFLLVLHFEGTDAIKKRQTVIIFSSKFTLSCYLRQSWFKFLLHLYTISLKLIIINITIN